MMLLGENIKEIDDTLSQTELARIIRASNDFTLDANRGVLTGVSYEHVVGRNSAVGSGSEEFIGFSGSALPTFLTSASTLVVDSTDANDTTAGSGARTIRIVGLDENWDKVAENVATNGTSDSAATTTTFIRVLRAFVLETGSYTAPHNLGDITIKTGGGDVLTTIEAEIGKSVDAQWAIPAGYEGYLTRVALTISSNKTADYSLKIRNKGNVTSAPYGGSRKITSYEEVDERYSEELLSYRKLDEYSDIWAVGQAIAGTTTINTTFDIIVVPKQA
ncbi:hypothetical protein KAR91_80970 [Candidatus Pacearchaeota archaeon]|nr:hypothetical protein [Candidatus Pacearchaeota archaeon]